MRHVIFLNFKDGTSVCFSVVIIQNMINM